MSKIYVILQIRTENIRPDQVTEILRRRPDEVVIKGADRVPPKSYPNSHGWTIEREDFTQNDVVGTVRAVLREVEPLVERIDEVRVADATCEVLLGVSITPFSYGLVLNWTLDMLQLLGRIGASFDIDFHRGETDV